MREVLNLVYYYLKANNENYVIYDYYPEDNKDRSPGIITINKVLEIIELTTPAEMDFERCAKEFDEPWYWYANHAIRCIIKDYNDGIIKEIGMSAWY